MIREELTKGEGFTTVGFKDWVFSQERAPWRELNSTKPFNKLLMETYNFRFRAEMSSSLA